MGEPRHQFAWTDENIAVAKDGMERGLSAAQIGLKINCTRNAVIGKMLRMGIKSTNGKGHQPGEPAPWKSTPKSRLTALLSSMTKAAPKPNMMTINARRTSDAARKQLALLATEKPVEAPSEPPPNAKSFEELCAGECRWPFGDGVPFLFCGEAQVKDRPYCAGHCRIAYQPTARLTKLRERYEVAA